MNSIELLVKDYYSEYHKLKMFKAGENYIPYSGRVFDEAELTNAVKASLEFWLTEGHYAKEFSERLAKYIGVSNCVLTNSGSSANLLAISVLTSEELGERQLKVGDEIITIASGFPTTLNPIIQNRLIPVFCDIDLDTYNIDISELEIALSKKTKAIILPHTLGNPFNVEKVCEFALKNNLWLIEDNCDALGSEYNGRKTGSFGDMSTLSFYPAHHITCGEGGAVLTNDRLLAKLIYSFRDWGRDCHCSTGQDNACGKRFSQKYGDLPFGYDHKYVYSHIGYNLKMTDIQAAIGLAQMDKLECFVQKRRDNYKYLYNSLNKIDDIRLINPEYNKQSWFGFPIYVKNSIKREELVRYLENHKVATRLMFGGNLLKQPAYNGIKYRISNGGYSLYATDLVMENTLFIGVYPGLTEEMLNYMIKTIKDFISGR